MPTPPPIIPNYPTPVPSSADPASFDSRADAFHAAAPTVVDGENAAAANVYANAVEAAGSALTALAAAAQAVMTANADLHDPVTDYAEGQNAISLINYQTYRRKSPGGVDAADPAASTLWERVGSEQAEVARYNMVRNGGFTVMAGNQTLTVTAANAHFDDRLIGWRAGSGGLSWSISTVSGERIVTISSGTLVQNIWSQQARTGTLYLTWIGTAQGRINGGAYGASGVSVAYSGGTTVSIEFTGGTLSNVQLSEGAPSIFLRRSLAEEEEMIKPYYWTSFGGVHTSMGGGSGTISGASMLRRVSAETASNFNERFPQKMAAVPTMTWISPVTGASGFIRNVTANAEVAVTGAGTSGPSQFSTGGVAHASNGAAGNVIAAHWIADARL